MACPIPVAANLVRTRLEGIPVATLNACCPVCDKFLRVTEDQRITTCHCGVLLKLDDKLKG